MDSDDGSQPLTLNRPAVALQRVPVSPDEPVAQEFRARRDWQSPHMAAGYRKKRHPSRYVRHFLEEAIFFPWVADLPRGARVLDVPCGTGRWVPTLTCRGFSYVGADISPHMVQEARSITGPPAVTGFLVADLARLPFADDSFDAVIVWRLLHHVPDTETRQALLREAARVSRDRVILSFHNAISPAYGWKVVRRALFGFKQGGRGITHWRLSQEARWSGLRVEQTRSFFKFASMNWFAVLRKDR